MKLNKCQKQLVTDNHMLLYEFAHRNNLNLEDWYDVLAIALCKAALYFDDSKGKFSTLFYIVADNEVKAVYRRSKASKRIPSEMCGSLEELLVEKNGHGGDITVLDTITDYSVNLELGLEIRDGLNRVLENLSNLDTCIIKFHLSGVTQKEIAKNLKISQSTVARHLKVIVDRIKEVLE